MPIYKIFTDAEWQDLQSRGRTSGAPVDLADGFIHFSTADQLDGTLSKHFAGRDGLVLAAVEPEPLGEALKWEPSRGGALFPHLYRELMLDEVAWHAPIETAGGAHVLPEGVA